MKVCQLFARCLNLTSGLLISMAFCSPSAFANSGAPEAFKEGVNYISVKPPLVVNYGPGGTRVRYIKAEISMRVEDAKAAEEVTHHMPLIRDTLIMLFSSMTDEQVGSGQGKEEMRQQALQRVNEALEKMEHPAKAEITKSNSEHKGDDKKSAADKSKESVDKSKESAEKPKETAEKDAKSNQEEHKGLVSDLLFDNLVVQR